jgi:toxin ParE1/3/4
MSSHLLIRKRAEDQIREAFSWYEQQRKGLDDDFLLSLESALQVIKDNPRLFRKKYKNVQMAMISRFP